MTRQSEPQSNSRSTEPRTVLPKEKARQGVTGHNVRWVLGISLFTVVIVLSVIYVSVFGV